MRTVPSFVAVSFLVSFAAFWFPVHVGSAGQESVGRRLPVRPISSVAGSDLYKEYCSQCHGAAGKGDGPAAASLKRPPSDLTQIRARNGGKFVRSAVENFIAGERPGGEMRPDSKTATPVVVYADGTVDEMPVYGILFRHLWQDQPPSIRASILARYVESLQAK